MRRGSLIGPLLIILIGVWFLVSSLRPDLPLLDIAATYWPLLLIAWGVLRLLEILVWAARSRPLPSSGVGGGGWTMVVFICLLGSALYAINHYRPWSRLGVIASRRIDVFGPDGKLKKGGLIDGRGYGDCGVGVDPAGNVYVGANVKPGDKPFPQAFMGKVPAKGWTWWKQPREAPWSYTYYNAYLFHWGSVLKFPPAGGAFYGHPWEGEKVEQAPPTFSVAGAPAGAASYRSAYLGREVKVAGALWRYGGFGIIPSSSDGLLPDPGCVCHNARLAVDEYGRVFVPNVFRFSVEMLDTNGNQLSRIGRYGNTDSAGPGSKVPEPEIAFAWPAFVSAAGGKLYVSDSVNRRVVVVRFEPSAAEECELPAGKSP